MACYIKIHKYNNKRIEDCCIQDGQIFQSDDFHLKTNKNSTSITIDNPTFSLQLRIDNYLENHYQSEFTLNGKTPKAFIGTTQNSITIEHLS